MDEDEAALLAELRAISAGAAGTSRFEETANDVNHNDTDDHTSTNKSNSNDDAAVVSQSHSNSKSHGSSKTELHNNQQSQPRERPLPPWKQPKAKNTTCLKNNHDDGADNEPIHTAANAAANAGGFQKAQTSTFQGDRGGDAEDAALLAELQAISKQSGDDRFAADNGGMEDNAATTTPKKTNPPPRPEQVARDNSKPKSSRFDQRGMDVLVSSGSEDQDIVSVLSEPSVFAATGGATGGVVGFQKSTLANTFQGDRGGAAEDEALLAELRAISAKSTSADRFAGSGEDANDNNQVEEPLATVEETEQNKEASSSLPPWKQTKTPVTQQQQNSATAQPVQQQPNDAAFPPSSSNNNTPNQQIMGGFQTTAMPNTFQGTRGGAAEDEDLLAELRAISSKSSSADRFATDNNNINSNEEEQPAAMEQTPAPSSQQPEKTKPKENASLPPWKRKGPRAAKPTASTKAADVGVAAVAAVAEPSSPGFKKSALPNTFQGDRGGAAEDDDLLAELRAISSKSGATDRFAQNDNDTDGAADHAPSEQTDSTQPPAKPKAAATANLPPWKRKGNQSTTKQAAVADGVVAALPRVDPMLDSLPQTGGFQKANMPHTFEGERGGTAEDEDLLAELRAISSSAGGSNRFAEDNNNAGGEAGGFDNGTPSQNAPSPPPTKQQSVKHKRKGQPNQPLGGGDDVVVAPPTAPAKPTEQEETPQRGGFEKSSLPNTFKGDRGGVAEDEALLAELRAISAGGSGANRFADDVDGESGGFDAGHEPVQMNSAAPSATPKKDDALPPWKRKGNQRANKSQPSGGQVDVAFAAPPPPKQKAPPEPAPQLGGFQESNLPNTFKGDRGGAAEDEALLAELRAISSGAGGTSRFNDDGGDGEPSVGPAESGGFENSTAKPNTDAALPPWKRKGPQSKARQTAPSQVDVVVGDPPQPVAAEDPNQPFGGFQKSELSNTFKGDRGGAAEDEALLAELRAISSGAGGSSRFSESNGGDMDQPQASAAAPPVRPKPQPPRSAQPAPATPTPRIVETSQSTPGGESELTVTLDDLPAALTDKSWKLRKEAFLLLKKTLSERVAGTEPTGEFDGGGLVEGLDSLIPGMLGDNNASALDSALDFSLQYADYCRGATMSGQAEEMVAALIKGTALSASRPSTVKFTAALVLKLIEVGDDGTASAHAVVDVLLRQGLTAKKPKIVITSAGLILLAANSFGAACLPLALVTSSAPKMLSHTNAKVRDPGMKIIAEIARALGSTSHIQGILDGMKKAQLDQLNTMIEKQPQPAPIEVGFRSKQGGASSGSPADALAALKAGGKELEAERFASRPAVNLVAEVAKTGYSTRVAAAKWSEKTAALDKVLECGGETPYKLLAPSSSVNYGPLISDMRKLLGNTHFAVCGKSMQVLAMLAEGAGEKLFPHLRPLLGTLFGLSKDKKLTKFLAPCLDSFFGCILSFDHLLEEDDALPEAVNERKQKNAFARTSCLDFLGRCVTRRESAGPRGTLTVKAAKTVADMSVSKLEDSDAGVRKAALGVLQNMQCIDDEQVSDTVSDIIEGLKKTNPRAHKTLCHTMISPSAAGGAGERKKMPPKQNAASSQSRTLAGPEGGTTAPASRKPVSNRIEPKNEAPRPKPTVTESSHDVLSLDETIEYMSQLDIPRFDESEEDDGVLAGLKATKWSFRQNAIKNLAAVLESSQPSDSSSEIEMKSGAFAVAVREHTRGFKETNVNVTKAIMEFFIAVCDYHYECNYPLMPWVMADAVTLAVDKLSDRKLSALGKGLLTNICMVCYPHAVVTLISKKIEKVKSPVSHEECQNWLKSFCNDFGGASLGNGIKELVPWLLKETSHSNIKVKKAALASIGTLHVQLGPIFKAVLMSQCKDNARDELEKILDSHPFDPSSASSEWPKVSIASSSKSTSRSGNTNDLEVDDSNSMGLSFDIPRMDLFASISGDCATKMGSKDGKTAWKMRKQAIDEVDGALKKCSALIDTSPQSLKRLAELARALRERLSDSQGNLKPLSARVIGSLLSFCDAAAQAKLGKIVHAPLINAAISDIKKPMREASLQALKLSTTISSIEGGGLNKEALESFANALAGEVNDTALKSVGLPDLLDFVLTFIEQMPNLDHVVVTRGQSLGEKTAHAFVQCLTSSKADTRNKAETILTLCVKNNVLNLDRIKTCTERMKPAQQRSVGPIMAKLARSLPSAPQREKENVPDDDAYEQVQHRPAKPSSARTVIKKQDRHAPSAPATSRASNEDHLGREGHGQRPRSPHKETAVHPLISPAGHQGIDRSRSALRSMTWPEYPEEPLGSDIFNQLKKAWSPILPPTSASAFFPAGGMRKQDDGHAGCDLLVKAILMERAGEGVAIEEQLELIFRWIAMVLCSKEHTVGLQALLTALNDLFVYMHEIKYELSDSEAILVVPFVLEKASLAKGRFKDVFADLVVVMKAEDVLPTKRLGSIVAVAMIERASHAKARLAACHDCARCVDQLGLSGIGKKGVLVAAKALSEETLSENRAACLDLMELVVARMNGDIQRLSRICGSSLSDRARRLVEERWQKNKTDGPTRPPEDSAARRSRIPTPKKGSPPSEKASRTYSPMPSLFGSKSMEPNSNTVLQDELPALILRSKGTASPAKETIRSTTDSTFGNSKNYLSNFDSGNESPGFHFSVPGTLAEDESKAGASNKLSFSAAPRSQTDRESHGAAASLRARLLKIREKSKHPETADVSSGLNDSYSSGVDISRPTDSIPTPVPIQANDGGPRTNPTTSMGSKSTSYVSGLLSINVLLSKETPLHEADKDLDDGIESMKHFHAALSKQQNVVVGITIEELSLMRQSIADNVDEMIEHLSALMHFSLDCLPTRNNAGISVSLLSVCLATLMALFRDNGLAVRVSKERLLELIQETGTALLDSRLVVNSQNSLDEATSSQVVRAINKLAVQAATGGAREASLSALMTLQRQLSFEGTSQSARLARVVTKLFTRVIKAEDSETSPWRKIDKTTIMVALNEHFEACNDKEEAVEASERDTIIACRKMAKSLVESMVKADPGAQGIRNDMSHAGIDQFLSPLGSVVAEYAALDDASYQSRPQTPSKGVATLVSALGSAQSEDEKETSLSALRRYTAKYGDADLDSHLEQVSPAFRKFILEQLSEQRQEVETQDDNESTASSMAERLRNLRSRLHTSDAQSTVSMNAAMPQSRLAPSSPSNVVAPGDSGNTSIAASRSAETMSVSSKSTSDTSSLRARLAAAQEHRKSSVVQPETSSTAGSRASALRARLQAVKQQAMDSSNK